MKALAAALLVAASALLPVQAQTAVPQSQTQAQTQAQGDACGATLDARLRRSVNSPTHQIAFAAQPAPAVGRHFSLDIVVCPRDSASLPQALRVDADMPAHRHGMNYRPTVRTLGEGRYRADGLLFHMAGRWRLLFELSADGRLDRISHEVVLE
jgi:hypothetical protein